MWINVSKYILVYKHHNSYLNHDDNSNESLILNLKMMIVLQKYILFNESA